MDKLPTELITRIIHDKIHRSHIVGLLCRTLKPHGSLAVMQTTVNRLERATNQVLLEHDAASKELMAFRAETQHANALFVLSQFLSKLRDVRVRHFPADDLVVNLVFEDLIKLYHRYDTAVWYRRNSLAGACIYYEHLQTELGDVFAMGSVRFMLGADGVMQQPGECTFTLTMHGIDPLRGTLELTGERMDGTHIHAEVSYMNGISDAMLKAIGFY